MKNLKMKSARATKDLSQQQLADLVGVSRQTINAIEKGDYNPTIRLCIAICKALDKTLDDLFWEAGYIQNHGDAADTFKTTEMQQHEFAVSLRFLRYLISVLSAWHTSFTYIILLPGRIAAHLPVVLPRSSSYSAPDP